MSPENVDRQRYQYGSRVLLLLRNSPLVSSCLTDNDIENLKIATLEVLDKMKKTRPEVGKPRGRGDFDGVLKNGDGAADALDKYASRRLRQPSSKVLEPRRRGSGDAVTYNNFGLVSGKKANTEAFDTDDGLAKFSNMSARDLRPTSRTSLSQPSTFKKSAGRSGYGERKFNDARDQDQRTYGRPNFSRGDGGAESSEIVPQLDPLIAKEYSDLLEPFDDLQKFKIALKFQELKKINPAALMEDVLPKETSASDYKRSAEVFNLKSEGSTVQKSKFARFFASEEVETKEDPGAKAATDEAQRFLPDASSGQNSQRDPADLLNIELGLKTILLKPLSNQSSASSLATSNSLNGSDTASIPDSTGMSSGGTLLSAAEFASMKKEQLFLHPTQQTYQTVNLKNKQTRSAKSSARSSRSGSTRDKASGGITLTQMLQNSIQGKRQLNSSASFEMKTDATHAPLPGTKPADFTPALPQSGSNAPSTFSVSSKSSMAPSHGMLPSAGIPGISGVPVNNTAPPFTGLAGGQPNLGMGIPSMNGGVQGQHRSMEAPQQPHPELVNFYMTLFNGNVNAALAAAAGQPPPPLMYPPPSHAPLFFPVAPNNVGSFPMPTQANPNMSHSGDVDRQDNFDRS